MTTLTRHSRRQKEAVRKRGSSLRDKAKQIGLKGSVRVLIVHEDPTHGVWHIMKHSPPGLAFPDINGLVNEYERTGQRPRVCGSHKNYTLRQNVMNSSAESTGDEDISDDDAFRMSTGSTAGESTGSVERRNMDWLNDAADVAADGAVEERESQGSHLDDDVAAADQMIKVQLEDTGRQAHQRLLRWIWGC